MAYLPEVATVLKLAFDHEGWTYGFDAGTGTLDAGFDLDSRIGQTPLYIHLLEDYGNALDDVVKGRKTPSEAVREAERN